MKHDTHRERVALSSRDARENSLETPRKHTKVPRKILLSHTRTSFRHYPVHTFRKKRPRVCTKSCQSSHTAERVARSASAPRGGLRCTERADNSVRSALNKIYSMFEFSWREKCVKCHWVLSRFRRLWKIGNFVIRIVVIWGFSCAFSLGYRFFFVFECVCLSVLDLLFLMIIVVGLKFSVEP